MHAFKNDTQVYYSNFQDHTYNHARGQPLTPFTCDFICECSRLRVTLEPLEINSLYWLSNYHFFAHRVYITLHFVEKFRNKIFFSKETTLFRPKSIVTTVINVGSM